MMGADACSDYGVDSLSPMSSISGKGRECGDTSSLWRPGVGEPEWAFSAMEMEMDTVLQDVEGRGIAKVKADETTHSQVFGMEPSWTLTRNANGQSRNQAESGEASLIREDGICVTLERIQEVM
jgi:hypothetical protein